jgi:hypothetical protein
MSDSREEFEQVFPMPENSDIKWYPEKQAYMSKVEMWKRTAKGRTDALAGWQAGRAQDGGEPVGYVSVSDMYWLRQGGRVPCFAAPKREVTDLPLYTRPTSAVVQHEPTRIMCEAGACVPLRDNQSEAQWMGEIFRAIMDAAPQQPSAVVPEWFNPHSTPPTHYQPVVGYHPEWIDSSNHAGVRECFTTGYGDVWLNSAWLEGADSYQTGKMVPLLWTHMPAPSKQEQES